MVDIAICHLDDRIALSLSARSHRLATRRRLTDPSLAGHVSKIDDASLDLHVVS